jgi:AraC-like DNA-binding protein
MGTTLIPYETSGLFRNLDTTGPETLVVYAMSGGKEVEIRRTKFDIRRFRYDVNAPFIVFPAGHYDAVISGPQASRGYVLHLGPEIFGGILRSEDAYPDLRVVAGGFSHPRLRRLMDATVRSSGNALLTKELTYSIAHVLLELEGRAPNSRGLGSLSTTVQSAIDDYCRATISQREDVDLDELMALAGLGATHFRMCFRATFGMNPHEYLQRLRIELATERMRSGDPRLSTLAAELGFSSAAHFSTRFKRVMGETPTAYAQRHGARIEATSVDNGKRRRPSFSGS